VSPEERMARIIAAELFTVGREVEKLAERYGAPEILRWARRITDDAVEYAGRAEKEKP
jgi:hypothetical protein